MYLQRARESLGICPRPSTGKEVSIWRISKRTSRTPTLRQWTETAAGLCASKTGSIFDLQGCHNDLEDINMNIMIIHYTERINLYVGVLFRMIANQLMNLEIMSTSAISIMA